jgi:uncharacterized integral membrane protein (TIGR00697 family)
MNDNQKKEWGKKLLIILICFYICIDLASDVVVHKLVPIGHLVINASAFCYPLTYLVNDIITELFGFTYGRLTIWVGILADWIFIWLVIGLVSLPSPEVFHLSAQFHNVLDPMARISIVEIPAIIIGRFLNIYLLSKSKVLLNSRFFWLRSMASSCFGTVAHSVFVDFLMFWGIASYSTIASIMFLNSLSDIFTIIFLSWIPVVIVHFLRNKIGIDEFNYKEKFNPFKI